MWNLAVPPLRQTLRGIAEWPVASHEIAQQNARVASTALDERRRERFEVEEFLAHRLEERTDEARRA